MDTWGGKMTDALFTLAEMAAVGFDMHPEAFTSRMKYGPHLLAPTGSDLKRFAEENTVLAGFHYDLNFLTIHGKSRFPGLNVWTRDGLKGSVSIPDGCLLVQVSFCFIDIKIFLTVSKSVGWKANRIPHRRTRSSWLPRGGC